MYKDLVRRWYGEMWNRGSEAVFDEILDPEIELRGSLGQTHLGPAGIAAYMRFVHNGIPDLRPDRGGLAIKSPLDASVYSASAGAFLLASVRRHLLALNGAFGSSARRASRVESDT
jgi:hypothetical protein